MYELKFLSYETCPICGKDVIVWKYNELKYIPENRSSIVVSSTIIGIHNGYANIDRNQMIRECKEKGNK